MADLTCLALLSPDGVQIPSHSRDVRIAHFVTLCRICFTAVLLTRRCREHVVLPPNHTK